MRPFLIILWVVGNHYFIYWKNFIMCLIVSCVHYVLIKKKYTKHLGYWILFHIKCSIKFPLCFFPQESLKIIL